MNHVGHLRWEYEQPTGCLYLADHQDGRALVARGYAGKGHGLNNPDAEQEIGLGPLPSGLWSIEPPIDHPRLGPVALRLSRAQIPYGRSGFLIHGDNGRGDRSASNGCIILGRPIREFIARSGIRTLMVLKFAE